MTMTRMSPVVSPMQMFVVMYAMVASFLTTMKNKVSSLYFQFTLALSLFVASHLARAACTAGTDDMGKLVEQVCKVYEAIQGLQSTAGGIYMIMLIIVGLGVVVGIIMSVFKG